MADFQTMHAYDEATVLDQVAVALPQRAPNGREAVQTETATRTVWVVLPAYNEQSSLPPLLSAIQSALEPANVPYGVIVVDDGSRDETACVAREASARLPVELISHDQNRGLAAAIRTGLAAAVERCGPADVIVTMDCDNTHPPRLIPQMLAIIASAPGGCFKSCFRFAACEIIRAAIAPIAPARFGKRSCFTATG
jgi:glycosyltransferase involved in cell wall biosynthesis